MSNGQWDRTDYLEEDVRRHSEELRSLNKQVAAASASLMQLNGELDRVRDSFDKQRELMDKELERRSEVISAHDKRLRDLETWKTRSGAYWAIFGSLAGGAAAYLVSKLGKVVLP